MSIGSPQSPLVSSGPPAVPPDPAQRLTVEQYHEMITSGILPEDNSMELLEGRLVRKMPKKPPHSVATKFLRKALERAIPPGWEVDSQEPITTSDSEPEPDGMVYRGNDRQYLDRHPSPEDVAMVAEVSNSSLQEDRTTKKRLYARARVPIYWIINLVDNQLEVYTDPSGPTEQPDYGQRQVYGPGDTIPLVIEGAEVGRIAVSDLLP